MLQNVHLDGSAGFPVPLQKRLTASVDKKMFVVGLTKGVKAGSSTRL